MDSQTLLASRRQLIRGQTKAWGSMKRAFSFKSEEVTEAKDLELIINDESFMLDKPEEMTGLELLRLTGDTGTVAGVYRLLARAISDDDWERFGKVTKGCQQKDFYRMAGAIIDLYSGNPTTAAESS